MSPYKVLGTFRCGNSIGEAKCSNGYMQNHWNQILALVYSMTLGDILPFLLSLVIFMGMTTVSTLIGSSIHANTQYSIRQFYYSFNCKYLGEGIISVLQIKKHRDAEKLNYLSKVSPRSFVQEILQARTLEWVAIPFSRGLSPPRDQTWVLRCCRWIRYCLSHQGSPR